MIRLDPTPLLNAARADRPHHQNGDCLYCYGRNGGGYGGLAMGYSANCVTHLELAELLGTSIRQVQRWRTGTRITLCTIEDLHRLDRMAVAAGAHPLTLWPELDLWAAIA